MIYDAVHQAVLLHEKHGTRLLELAAPLSCRRPARGSSSFRRCGRSSTKHWKSKRATTKKAA